MDFNKEFLDPAGSNINQLAVKIDQILGGIPQNNLRFNPFIGEEKKEKLMLTNTLDEKSIEMEYLIPELGNMIQHFPKWNSPSAMHNINPPMLLDSVATSTVIDLFAPNAIWDFVSGDSTELEGVVVRQVSELIGEEFSESKGVFTFGGKGCLMYAIRLGINRVARDSLLNGLPNVKPVVITSTNGHYSIELACEILGIGRGNCIRIPTNDHQSMDMDELEKKIRELTKAKVPIATVILSGGTTLDNFTDSPKEVKELLSMLEDENILPTVPYIYFDTVVSWAWLMFQGYDFSKNVLNIPKVTKRKVQSMFISLEEAKYSDGIGIDFHKTGFVPYASSLFIAKKKEELLSIFDVKDSGEKSDSEVKAFGDNFNQYHTIEHSRSCAPIFAAWIALQRLGKVGFRDYIVQEVGLVDDLIELLEKNDFSCLNKDSRSYSRMIWVNTVDKRSFSDFKDNSTIEELELNNKNLFLLFNYLKSPQNNETESVLTGYLPDYIKAKNGSNIASIRLFPMSAVYCKDDNRKICEIFVNSLERYTELSDVKGSAPIFTPR